MTRIFTLPFDICDYPYDWLVVCLILLNTMATIAYILSYIEFRLRPPHPKYNINSTMDYLVEFTIARINFIAATLFIDFMLLLLYILYVLAMFIHLIIFEL